MPNIAIVYFSQGRTTALVAEQITEPWIDMNKGDIHERRKLKGILSDGILRVGRLTLQLNSRVIFRSSGTLAQEGRFNSYVP